MSNILEDKFKKFLTDEGLSPKNQASYKLLKRAFYTGATEYYSGIQNAGKKAKQQHGENEEEVVAKVNEIMTELRESISEYWKGEVIKGTNGIIKPHNKIITLDDLRKGG